MSNSNPAVLSFSERVEKAAKAAKVDKDKLLTALSGIGVEPDDEDSLEVARVYGDIEKVFTDAGAKPARAAMGVDVLIRLDDAEEAEYVKLAEQPKSDVAQLLEAQRPVEQWKDQELVEAYGIDGDLRVTDTLAKRSKGQAFVVFNDDGSTDVELTVELLRLTRRQTIPEKYPNKDGKLKSVYRIGEFPMTYVEESPLFEDVILVNGFCQESNLSWANVSIDDRVIVRVAAETVVMPTDHLSVKQLVERIEKEGDARFLLTGPIEHKYSELENDNRLPRLRRKYSTRKNNGDPFHVRTSGHRSH